MANDALWDSLEATALVGDGEAVAECATALITRILNGGSLPQAAKAEGYNYNAALHMLRLVRRVAPRTTNCRELAKDLISEASDHAAQGGNDE